jgi:hypothetical protein
VAELDEELGGERAGPVVVELDAVHRQVGQRPFN